VVMRILVGVVLRGVFYGVYFSGVPPIYGAFCLYSHSPVLFVLNMDLVV
jgi:hypothetical protein